MCYNSGMKKTIIGLVAGTLGVIGVGTAAPSSVKTDKSTDYNSSKVTEEKKPEIETKIIRETETIPYETITREDASLAKGNSRVETEGVNGEKVNVYEVKYKNGTELSRKIVSSEVTKSAVNKVVVVGTYVAPTPAPAANCQNGTYVNSAGNTICRPSSSNTGGATAICNDGTYSYSQSRRGTCSHHGGVRSWL